MKRKDGRKRKTEIHKERSKETMERREKQRNTYIQQHDKYNRDWISMP